jgi:hypothetical protein
MKTEISQALNASGNVYNVKVQYDNKEVKYYDFFSLAEVKSFLEGLYARNIN